MIMGETIIEATGLTKQFFRKGRESAQTFNAVDSVDFQLKAGELVVLMGRSGSGKTTLLNMLAGLLDPTEGTVFLDGEDLYALDDTARSRLRNQKIGVVPQGQTALFSLTVEQNVELPFRMYAADADMPVSTFDLLKKMGIESLAESYPQELSGGELRRMAIARALACNPRVILADEPTGDLDDQNTDLVLDVLREAASQGAAVLVVTHELHAQKWADRILHMNAGVLSSDCVAAGEEVGDAYEDGDPCNE